MKNRLCSILAILCLAGIIFGCAEQTKDLEPEAYAPEPLTIESTEWTPHGVFEGTIVISGEGIAEAGYEGILYVEPDGDKIRISCTGAVRSRYGELF